MDDTDWSDNIFYQLAPDINWVTTYIQKIEFDSSKLVILLDAGLMTYHPKFDQAKISSPDCSVRMELRIIFNDITDLRFGDEKKESLEINLGNPDERGDQLEDLVCADGIYTVSFDHTETIVLRSQPPISELGNYILSDTYLGSIDNGIDWSLSSLIDIQVEKDVVFEIAACLNSWHPRFQKSKVKGHWGKYHSTLRFPNVKEFHVKPKPRSADLKFELTPDKSQILDISEEADGYSVLLDILSEPSNLKLTINSEPPVFEIGNFISSGPFIRSPYQQRLGETPDSDDVISDLMGELKTPPKGSVNEWNRMALFFVPITFALLFLIAKCTGYFCHADIILPHCNKLFV